jgi:hypothetical protein
MAGPQNGAGSNPPVGGSSANDLATNPPVGGSPGRTPAQTGTPAGAAGSNPLAGGSDRDQATSPDDDAPVPADVYRERVRAEAALRKRLSEIEAQLKDAADAKLTESERDKKHIAELEADRANLLLDRQRSRIREAIADAARDAHVVNTRAALTLFLADYGDQLDYDEQGTPSNAEFLFGRFLAANAYLVEPPAPDPRQMPSGGRLVSPPRPGLPSTGRPALAAQPRPLTQADSLSNLDWNQYTSGTGHGTQRG